MMEGHRSKFICFVNLYLVVFPTLVALTKDETKTESKC